MRMPAVAATITGSTPLPVDRNGRPLAFDRRFARNPAAMAWLWKDHTSIAEAAEITELARKIRPDVILMDVNMPGMSGFETAQLLLAGDNTIRVVMLTANIQQSSREVAQSLNIRFVAKPATEASLQQALEHLLAPVC